VDPDPDPQHWIKQMMSGANDLVWQTVCYFTAS
jgi:hypothetical protein